MPTAGISLVREHTEGLKPPRALWVPFELGRPFGVPRDPAFQIRVLKAVLALFDQEDGPVILEDFPEDAPKEKDQGPDGEGWVCPVRLPVPESGEDAPLAALLEEIRLLAPWHEVAVGKNNRSTTGAAGMTIKEAAQFLHALRSHAATGNPVDPPAGMTPGEAFRHASQELKAWFFEAAASRPGAKVSSETLNDWFWGETAAGALFLALYTACRDSDDRAVRVVARDALVPRVQRYRLDSLNG